MPQSEGVEQQHAEWEIPEAHRRSFAHWFSAASTIERKAIIQGETFRMIWFLQLNNKKQLLNGPSLAQNPGPEYN